MKDRYFRLLLVMASSPCSLTPRQMKAVAGGMPFSIPYELAADMHYRGWLNREPSAIPGCDGAPVPRYYSIAELGREALAEEIQRRAHR